MTQQERKQRTADRKAALERSAMLKREARAVVASGICPRCGSPLRRNLALAGWWQCSQFGADGFRADSTKPACDWQAFTE